MGKAGGIITIIAGVLGILAGFATLFMGGLSDAFEAKGAANIISLGWGGIFTSLMVVVSGGVALAKPRIGGIGTMVLSIVGIVFGGTLVAICLALSLVGGALAILSKPQSDQIGEEEPWRKRWMALAGSIVTGIVLVVIGFALEDQTKSSESQPAAAAETSTATALLAKGATAAGEQFEVTLHSAELLQSVSNSARHIQAPPGTVFAVLDISVKCIDRESRWYSPGDLIATVNGQELKYDKQETFIGVTQLFGQINPLSTSRGIVVFNVPIEAAQGQLAWYPGRGFGETRFAITSPPASVAVTPIAAPDPVETGIETYRNGGSKLELALQPDGNTHFNLLVVGDSGNTGEIQGVVQLKNGAAIWHNEDAHCLLTLRQQDDTFEVSQQGSCDFGDGVIADGEYKK